MEIGLGQLRLSPDEFWNMTPLEFLCAQRGFMELFKMQDKADWVRTIELINIQLPKGKRINPNDLFKEKPKKVMTEEQRRAEIEKISNLKHWQKWQIR